MFGDPALRICKRFFDVGVISLDLT